MSDEKSPSEALKELGNAAFAAKDYVKAIEYYTQAIQKDAYNHVFFSNRSACYLSLDQWDKAAVDAKECIRLNPAFVKGYYRLASAQMSMPGKDHYDAAMATIRQGLTVEPNNAQLTKQLRIVQQQKKLAETKTQQNTLLQQQQGRFLDETTAKELQELQNQLAEVNRAVHSTQANIHKTEQEYKLAELTRDELHKIPASSRCYRSVGKMFLHSPHTTLVQQLNDQMIEAEKTKKDLRNQMEYLERRTESQRQNIQELVQGARENVAEES